MARNILIDEFHVTVYAPRGLPPAEFDAIRRTLDGLPFRSRLRRAVLRVVRRFAALNKVRVAVTR